MPPSAMNASAKVLAPAALLVALLAALLPRALDDDADIVESRRDRRVRLVHCDSDAANLRKLLKHTVSYDKVVQTATEAFCSRRYRLVEAAAGAVAEAVLERYSQVRHIRVTVHKPHAPIAATFDDVGVVIERTRQERNQERGRG